MHKDRRCLATTNDVECCKYVIDIKFVHNTIMFKSYQTFLLRKSIKNESKQASNSYE